MWPITKGAGMLQWQKANWAAVNFWGLSGVRMQSAGIQRETDAVNSSVLASMALLHTIFRKNRTVFLVL